MVTGEMGVILMRPLTSGVFQRLMAEAWSAVSAAIEIDVLDVGRLLLNYVLSDPYVDVALVGMREPRFVARGQALAPEISDDVASRIDGCEAHLGSAARSVCKIERCAGLAVFQRTTRPVWSIRITFGRIRPAKAVLSWRTLRDLDQVQACEVGAEAWTSS